MVRAVGGEYGAGNSSKSRHVLTILLTVGLVSAHAQVPQFTAVSVIADWLNHGLRERPPPPEPPLAADTVAPPHRRAVPSLRLPPPRSAELAPTSLPPNKTATVPISVLTQQRSGLR
jgi:hypothetical protein